MFHLQPLSPHRVASRDHRFQRMALALAAARIAVGLVWISNLTWKLPPDFGRDDARGLLYSFRLAEQHALTSPVRDLVGSLVIPHFSTFGWIVFLVEAVAGVSLVLGFHTTVGAALGTAQSVAIAILVAPAPDEWKWGYLMFVLLNALPLAAPANLRVSIDALQRRT